MAWRIFIMFTQAVLTLVWYFQGELERRCALGAVGEVEHEFDQPKEVELPAVENRSRGCENCFRQPGAAQTHHFGRLLMP